VALLYALRVIHKVVEPAAVGLRKKELEANAKRIAEGDWAAQAVRQAIDSTNAAIYTVIFSTVAAGGGASS
jgi:hypothetical protein